MSPGRRTLPHAVVQASKLAPTHSEADRRRLGSPRRRPYGRPYGRTLPCVAATLVARQRTWLGVPILAALGAAGALAAGCLLPEVSLPPKSSPHSKSSQRPIFSQASASQSTLAPDAIRFSGHWDKTYDLADGQAVEISAHIDKPSGLPPNGRI